MMLNLEDKLMVTSSKIGFCDTHVIANSISVELANFFRDSGFSEQNIIGGDSCVRMQHLWSKKFSTVQEADICFKKSQFYIKQDKSFVGYIEEEVIAVDEPISNLPLDEAIWDKLLPKLSPSPCSEGIVKACDIHLALHQVNSKVDKKFLESGFYYLDLYKPNLGNVRIYTMQTQNRKVGRQILRDLKKTLAQGGGVEGFLKFEVTRKLYNQGFSLPPLIYGNGL
ncbi:hypothetical protein [Nostoc sp. ATCC 53789]|uniref:hypothetical protein n=1 Tax=Nostoc sp. ATCC 53789 TaxID=76335 RepID=UPI000DED36DC|nr:hypothetical protein [Nostoc sp. ATCC 53789]QHG21196.1 hypothetical protein GJB62_35700 [Nostoc sp. ATCC 53789]RCJ16554.1 hypothetical protein A6V25_31010 [Nostoc sp. ATCC 53789]